jgi:hypothetical protein
LGQFLRYDPGFGNDGNKTRVTYPTRQHVHVKVVGNSGAGRTPQVEANIVTIRSVFTLQGEFAELSQVEKLVEFVAVGVLEKREVAPGRDQNVARGVGIEV